MAQKNNPVSLAGEYVKCPVALLEDGRLTPTHRNLWLILLAHCITEDSCFPSITRLAKFLGLSGRWTKSLLIDLERLGYLTRVFRKGKCTVYSPRMIDNPGSTLHPFDPTQEVHFTPPRKYTSPHPGSTLHPETDTLKQKIVKHAIRPAEKPYHQQKKKANQKGDKTSVVRESVVLQIDALDLTKFRTQYADLNIEDEHESFKDHFLGKNDPKTGKPNWLKWSDWNRAFHRWLKNARQYAAEKGPAKGQADPPSNNPAYKPIEIPADYYCTRGRP